MNENNIRNRLIEHGQTLFQAPKQLIQFTRVPEADSLLNDLEIHLHAFVLACVMDRQIKGEKAWLIPYRISEKLNGFSMNTLRNLSRADVNRLMTQPEPLHRFTDKMSGFFQLAVQHINTISRVFWYDGFTLLGDWQELVEVKRARMYWLLYE